MRMPLAPLVSISLVILPHAALAVDKADFKRPDNIPFPKDAPYSPQAATLGKMLFFDPRLSGAQNMNCASCHNPSFGFEVPVKTPVGAANTALKRKAPTIINSAWTKPLFWDGRAPSLEAQATGPISNPKEMNGHFDDIIRRIGNVAEYKDWFGQVFPRQGITKETILTSIATYERTVVAGEAPFDHWVDGDETAISDSAKRGFQLFTGKAGCSDCHAGWNFTDNKFHDIGLPSDDIGRGAIEKDNPKAQYAFKTPGLRNIIYRAPYMHDGSLPNLRSVIDHYISGGVGRPSQSPLILPLVMNNQDVDDLIAFLKSLTAAQQNTPLPTLPN